PSTYSAVLLHAPPILSAHWASPIRPANTVLEHYSLAITGDRITALLPTAEALQQFQPRQHVELTDHVLMPGLINMHGHAAMTLLDRKSTRLNSSHVKI